MAEKKKPGDDGKLKKSDEDLEDDDQAQDDDEEEGEDDEEEDDEDQDPKKKRKETDAERADRLERELLHAKGNIRALERKNAARTDGKGDDGTGAGKGGGKKTDQLDPQAELSKTTQQLATTRARLRELQKVEAVRTYLSSDERGRQYLDSADYMVHKIDLGEEALLDDGTLDPEMLKDAATQAAKTFIKKNPRATKPNKKDDDDSDDDGNAGGPGGEPNRGSGGARKPDNNAVMAELDGKYGNFFSHRMGVQITPPKKK